MLKVDSGSQLIYLSSVTMEPERRHLTDIKVKQAWMYAASFLAAAGTVGAIGLAMAVAMPWLVAAAPLASIAGGLLWVACDLENDPALQFDRQTQGLRCDAIAQKYRFKDFKKFDFLTTTQIEVLSEAEHECGRMHTRDFELEKQFRDRTPEAHQALRDAEALADQPYVTHPAYEAIRAINQKEHEHKVGLRSIANASRNSIRRSLETVRYDNREHETFSDLERYWSDSYWDELCSLEWELKRDIAEAERCFAEERAPFKKAIEPVLEERNRAILAAREEFRIRTLPVRQEIDALKAENRKQYEEKISQLDDLYRGVAAYRQPL